MRPGKQSLIPCPDNRSHPQSCRSRQLRLKPSKFPWSFNMGPSCNLLMNFPLPSGQTFPVTCHWTILHWIADMSRFFFSRGNYGIKDLTGRNQVLVNNRPIASSSPLIPGDKLFLTSDGPAFHFIEGGRMAEIHMPQKEACRDNESAASQKKEAPSGEKRGSLFKNFFR